MRMTEANELEELHALMGVIHSINVGLLIIDREYRIKLWNDFMENRSGKRADAVMGKYIFELFPEIPNSWFTRKIESVITLKTRAFTTWEQRPYLFKFKNYRPITGGSEFMYQNITFLPLMGMNGTIKSIAIVIYDVTDTAISKHALETANEELSRLSKTDRLTQLNNRGHWEECLHAEFDRYKRTGQNVTLIMFDIDHFKNINDTFGHQAGDEVIRQAARTLRRTVRKTDIPGRYGGEEFAVILVDTDLDNAMILAERIRKRVESLTVKYDGMKINFSISLGVAQLNESVTDYNEWLEQSDKALYFSKQNGRNQSNKYSPEIVEGLKNVG